MYSIRAIVSFYVSLIYIRLERNVKLYSFFFAIFDLAPTVKEVAYPQPFQPARPFQNATIEADLVLHPSTAVGSELVPGFPPNEFSRGVSFHQGRVLSQPLSCILEEEPETGPREELWEVGSDTRSFFEDQEVAWTMELLNSFTTVARGHHPTPISAQEVDSLTNGWFLPESKDSDFAFPKFTADCLSSPSHLSQDLPFYDEYDYQRETSLLQKTSKCMNCKKLSVVRRLNFDSPTDMDMDEEEIGKDSDDDIVPSVGSWEVEEGSDGTISERSEKKSRSKRWKFWFHLFTKPPSTVSPSKLLSSCSDRLLSCSGRMTSFREEDDYRVGSDPFGGHEITPRKSVDGERSFRSWVHKAYNGERSFDRSSQKEHRGEKSFDRWGQNEYNREVSFSRPGEREEDVIRRLVKGSRAKGVGLTVADILKEEFG